MVRLLIALLLSLALSWWHQPACAVAPTFFLTTGTISSADILNAHVTPKVLVAAQGANTVVMTVKALFIFTPGTQYTGTGQAQLRYSGTSNYPSSAVMFNSSRMTGVTTFRQSIGGNSAVPTTTFNLRNVGIEYFNSAQLSTGTGTIHYEIVYWVATSNH